MQQTAKQQRRAIAQALAEAKSLVRDGHGPAAEQVLRSIMAVDPAHAETLHQLGIVLRDQQRLDEALSALAAAAKIDRRNPLILNDMGMVLTALGRRTDALTVYDAALGLAPGEPAILGNRGNTLAQLDRLQEALVCYDEALRRDPKHLTTIYNRGNTLLALKRLPEAVASYDRVLKIKPDFGPAFNNRGNAKIGLGLDREAAADYERAAALMPDDVQVGCNLGVSLYALNRDEDALAAYARVLGRDPADAKAHYNAALSLLRMGDFKRGWREYEWRWGCPFFLPHVRNLPAPLWLGEEDLAGKRILLHGEQGFGDMIQFVRYAPLVKQKGATVILEMPRELAPLTRSVASVDEFVVNGDPLPRFDLQCPLLSLPRALATEIATIPASVPYLTVPPDRAARWSERLRTTGRPLIGLVWSGRSTHARDHHRSLAFATLAPLLAAGRGSFVSLQLDIREADRDAFAQSGMLSLAGELTDFADTAAAIAALDLLITVDTSVAHLAGALGKPVWILLQWAPDFRWLQQREDSPWYPTARLFRQPAFGDWQSVISRVADELAGFTGG